MKKYALIVMIMIMTACNVTGNAGENDKDLSYVDEVTQNHEIDEEFKQDTEQVFLVIEGAQREDRNLDNDEKSLMGEYDAKYENVDLNEREKMILSLVKMLSVSTKEYAELETDKGHYGSVRESLLDYIDLPVK